MKLAVIATFLFAAAAASQSVPALADSPHAWGPLPTAMASGKPVLLLVMRSWCDACVELWDDLNASDAFAKASDAYALALLVDERTVDELAPDGHYYPRALFLWDGQLQPSIRNLDRREQQYFYSSSAQLLATMRHAVG
eukprot:PLAT13801.1.p1 GENE.PLAT13801.1~~PLAT13801.1.p1  ORF type:complete len:139 (-),score=30.16 PLAT13801.1:89-505(-)